MARAGLGEGWRCLFANDFDAKKAETYRANWGGDELFLGDVRKIETAQLPGIADLVWASFPCQDLSLAGAGAGLGGRAQRDLLALFRPRAGLARGRPRAAPARVRKRVRNPDVARWQRFRRDLRRAGEGGLSLRRARHRRGALPAAIAAAALHRRGGGDACCHPPLWRKIQPDPFIRQGSSTRRRACRKSARNSWVWWRLAPPHQRNLSLAEFVEARPRDVAWRSEEETRALVSLMNVTHREGSPRRKQQAAR